MKDTGNPPEDMNLNIDSIVDAVLENIDMEIRCGYSN